MMKRARLTRSLTRSLAAAATVLGLLLFSVAAAASADAQSDDDPAQVEAGKAVFEMSCAGCHAVDGTGVAGAGRPLIGIAGQGDRATHIASVTDGKGPMPAFGGQLSEEEIAQAVSYVRLTFVEDAGSSAEAETTSADEELARTGVETSMLAVVGASMLLGGAHMVVWSNRRRRDG